MYIIEIPVFLGHWAGSGFFYTSWTDHQLAHVC